MTETIIGKNEAGQRLNKYLMKYLDKAPSSFIYKMLRKKNIVLNAVKAKGDEIIHEGDHVKLFLSDETISNFRTETSMVHPVNKTARSGSSLAVLFRNEDYIAVHKPAGVLSQQSVKTDYSINEQIIDYVSVNNILSETELRTFKPSVCNRLDRNTSGIILAGISLLGSQRLTELLRTRAVDKYYFTVVKGVFPDFLDCRGYIKKDTENNKSEVISVESYEGLSNKQEYNPIETRFEKIDSANELSLVRIKLITGKSHQIRAHLNALSYPVIGDNKYGDLETNRYFRDNYKLKYHLLHAGLVIMPDKTVILDELPEKFIRICKDKGLDTNQWLRGIQEA